MFIVVSRRRIALAATLLTTVMALAACDDTRAPSPPTPSDWSMYTATDEPGKKPEFAGRLPNPCASIPPSIPESFGLTPPTARSGADNSDPTLRDCAMSSNEAEANRGVSWGLGVAYSTDSYAASENNALARRTLRKIMIGPHEGSLFYTPGLDQSTSCNATFGAFFGHVIYAVTIISGRRDACYIAEKAAIALYPFVPKMPSQLLPASSESLGS